MTSVLDRPYLGSSDSGDAAKALTSAGRGASGWIQPPATRPGYVVLVGSDPVETHGAYASVPDAELNSARRDILLLSETAATSFWEFEDGLPENDHP